MHTDPLAPRACRPDGCARLCTADGLAQAYRAHRAPLLGRARRLLGDAGLAEEVVQETFLRAWRSCASFDPDGPPLPAWLGVIMRNLALDRIKARSRRPPTARWDSSALATRPDHAEALLLRDGLVTALAGLRAEQRTAVLQTVLLDRPHHEVAAELGVPVGTVKSRAHYGLRRMRRLLDVGSGDIQMGNPHRSARPRRERTLSTQNR